VSTFGQDPAADRPGAERPDPNRPGEARPTADTYAVYAGFWRRFWAFWLDVAFLWALVGLLGMVVPDEAWPAVALLTVLVVAVWTAMLGGSVGKRMLGLRVLREHDGGLLGLIRAVMREVLVKPASIGALGVGVLWMLDHPNRQTWHDIAGGSVVVRDITVASGPLWGAQQAVNSEPDTALRPAPHSAAR